MLALTRYRKPACTIAWSIFIVYECLIGYDHYYSKYPLCPYTHNTDQWSSSVGVSVVTGFLLTLIIVCMKIIKINYDDTERLPYLVMLNIVLISSIGSILSVFFNWGGMCIDSLG